MPYCNVSTGSSQWDVLHSNKIQGSCFTRPIDSFVWFLFWYYRKKKFKILHVPQKLTFWFISCHDEPLSSKCVMNECVKSTNEFLNKSLCNGCADECPNLSFSDKISLSSEPKNLLWCVLVVLNLFHWTSCLQNHLENWFPGFTQPLYLFVFYTVI